MIEGTNNGIGAYFSPGIFPPDPTLPGYPYSAGAFLTKLTRGGSALEYSTYFEGQATLVNGLAVDSTGTVYLTGSAPTAGAAQFGGFQATPAGLATPASPGNTAFLVKLNSTASVLNYATLLGGGANDVAMALALDREGNVYLTGSAYSTDFPTTSRAFQTVNNAKAVSGNNAFVSKFALADEANQTVYPGVPASIGTTMSGSAYIDPVYCFIALSAAVNPDSFGPPVTGTVFFDTPYTGYMPPVGLLAYGWGSPVFSGDGGGSEFGGSLGTSIPWAAYYSGDSLYGSSQTYGSVDAPPACGGSQTNGPALKPTPQVHLEVKIVQGKGQSTSVSGSTPAKSSVPSPKFTLPPASVPEIGPASQATPSGHSAAQSQATTACIAPHGEGRDDDQH